MLINNISNIILILLVIILSSCGINEKTIEINNLNSNKIVVLGHRGMGKNYIHPGNTFESISTAIELGADGSEIDVQVTKDSILVIYHNKDLSSLTNYTGFISDYNWSDLDSCVYVTNNNKVYNVISVDELFNSIPEIQRYYFSIDCKFNYGVLDTSSYMNAFIYGINKVVTDYHMVDKIIVEAGSKYFHKLLKENSQVLQFVTGSNIEKIMQIAKELDLFGVGIGSSISRADILMAHRHGLRVMTWAPKTKWGNLKAIRKSPDIIQTSKVKHMLGLLEE
ncbi:glycerophosphodiester phosphodiesterase [Candidatus Neomarinimicrobiota bacterium]